MCEQKLFNSRETSAVLGVPVATLRWWATEKHSGGLLYPNRIQPNRIGTRLYYTREAIDQFVQEVKEGKHAYR